MLKTELALDELSSEWGSSARGIGPGAERSLEDEIVTLCNLRGYGIQIDYLERLIKKEELAPRLWLIDNLGIRAAPNSNELSRLIGLVWQQQRRLEGAKVAWIASRACSVTSSRILNLSIELRTFKSVRAGRAWLLGES